MSGRDGGPAFPVRLIPKTGEIHIGNPRSTGMSLRDYFAGQALVGMLANEWWQNEARGLGATEDVMAKWAYDQADAMLAARSAPTNGGTER